MMTSISAKKSRNVAKSEEAELGFFRVRDDAFHAIYQLWLRRKSNGVTVTDLAKKLQRDKSWVSKHLRGPGNWTLRTFGEFVAALDGEAEIRVHGLEDPVECPTNFDIYADLGIFDSIILPAPVVSANAVSITTAGLSSLRATAETTSITFATARIQ